MEIEGSTALVTGASKRIGKAIALRLAAHGCNVAIHYHNSRREAFETRDQARQLGVRSEAIPADLADPEQCARLWSQTVDVMGDVPCIVVNNASFFTRVGIQNVSAQAFDVAMGVNVRAPMLLAQFLDRDLPAENTGKIVSINDRRRVYRSRFTYSISNSALTGLTKALAVSLAPRIQVNELRLGVILPLSDAGSKDSASISDSTLGPAGRVGTLDEVSQAVTSVIGNDYINGASLTVDGGLSAID